ncbi:MAG: hydroxysqualene dehydroxylase HpnE [Gammaproteobacteria bacterium]|nr:hydroxysqualene dehydroxylase HpnE [Gammaproteobacteria bacterium]
MTRPELPVIIAGAGWAGLAAAVELSRYDIPVTVLESAKQIGGRARRVPFKPADTGVKASTEATHSTAHTLSVDNGQHLLIGAFESTLSLMRTIGVREQQAFKRINLSLTIMCGPNKTVDLQTPNLPAPLHFVWGLLTANGLSLRERFKALWFYHRLAKQDFTLAEDESCASLFDRHHQSDNVIKTLWKPLCLGSLNTPIDQASAQVFLRILRESLTHTRHDSNLLLPQQDLSAVVPDPAMDFIERRGGSVKLGQRVQQLHINHEEIVGLTLDDRSLKARHVILATPCQVTAKLCQSNPDTAHLGDSLTRLRANPICTVYLQYPEDFSLKQDMLGIVDTVSQWVFDRKIYGQAGLMAVVISGPGKHMTLSNAQLIQTVTSELAQHFPHWPQPLHTMVVRERRATFHCAVNINKIRPANTTPVQGLWIAGDYTNTGLPATLEGAVRSGVRAARRVMESMNE